MPFNSSSYPLMLCYSTSVQESYPADTFRQTLQNSYLQNLKVYDAAKIIISLTQHHKLANIPVAI